MKLRLFKSHSRQSGGIQRDEVANFARNEKTDVCTQTAGLPFIARDEGSTISNG
jgi:hypothetical protein